MVRKSYAHNTFLPRKIDDENLANWLALERSFHDIRPICVGGTGDPGSIPIGSPSPFQAVTWTQNANPLYDHYNMIGPTPTANIRIPWDGFYSFWMCWQITDAIGNTNTQLQCAIETANTSDTGFGAPAFTSQFSESHTYGTNAVGTNIDTIAPFDYRHLELHANDLVRFRVRQNGPDILNNCVVLHSEFRFLYPIPSELP